LEARERGSLLVIEASADHMSNLKLVARHLQQLQDGAPVIQQPYSQAAAGRLCQLLNTAPAQYISRRNSNPVKIRPKDVPVVLCQMLQLLNTYLRWFLPSISSARLATRPETTTTSSSSSSSSSTTTTTATTTRQSAGDSSPINSLGVDMREQEAHFFMCMLHFTTFARHVTETGQAAAAAVRPQLTAEGTGELQSCGSVVTVPD
jgi:hypothetical protein